MTSPEASSTAAASTAASSTAASSSTAAADRRIPAQHPFAAHLRRAADAERAAAQDRKSVV